MSPFSPREELLKLHQQIFRQNKRVIRESVIHEERDFKSYERRYLKSVRDYKSLATPEEMLDAAFNSHIVYVGDYHTLKQSQRSLLRILRALKTSKLILGMEVIQARHQHGLESYMAGSITDKTFLQKIGFRKHWFFDLWENFKPLFDYAKENRIPVFGLEADPSEGTSLRLRDQKMAATIVDLHLKYPDHLIFVFVGDLHLAPQHLPKEVLKGCRKKKIFPKTLVLYQNSEVLYWKLAQKELEQTPVVKISKQAYCLMNTPPILCQQSYLNWLEHEEGSLDFADVKQTFLEYMDRMATFLGLELGPEKEEVEIFTCGDLSFLKRLRESGDFSPREIREIKRQILRSESYTIPKRKLVYLANVSVNHAAEEASHTIRHLCAGDEFPRPMQDAFYANILHEALGFFGSKLINPHRKCLRPSDSKRLIRYLEASHSIKDRLLEYTIASLLLQHEAKVGEGIPFHTNTIAALSVDFFIGLTHAIGYYLGEKIFYGLLEEQISKAEVSNLFKDPFYEDGEAVRRYFELESQLRPVKLPKRM